MSGTPTLSISIGEVSGDAIVDLAVIETTAVSVLLGTGNGAFAFPHSYAPGGKAVALGDINGDGKADLVVAGDGGVTVLLNQGRGIFGPFVSYAVGTGSTALALGDLNGDGRLDIAVANSGNSGPGDVAVLLNTGGATFSAANYAAGSTPTSIAVGDLDGDCRADLAVADGGGGINVLLNGGKGTFKAAVGYAAGTNPRWIAIGDLNGDGRPDLTADGTDVGSGVTLFNYGDGTFTAAVLAGPSVFRAVGL